MKNKELINTLKELINKDSYKVCAVPLNPENLKKNLTILHQHENFDKLKKEFYEVRDNLSQKANISKELASSIINYALHI